MKRRRRSGAINERRTRYHRLWEAMPSWLGGQPSESAHNLKATTVTDPARGPIWTNPTPAKHPMAAVVPTVPPSLQSDGCQMPYPSQEEMYLGTRSLGTVHVAAFIGCSGIPQSPAFLSSPFLIYSRSVFLHKSPVWQSQILPPPL